MARRIKILFGLEAGDAGALKHLVSLACGLDKIRFSITVILSTARSSRIFKEIDRMKMAGVNVLLFPMDKRIHITKDILLVLKLRAHLKEHKYDIVHAHSSKAGLTFRLAARIAKIDTIIYTPHCFYFQSKSGVRRWFFSLAEKLLGIITTQLVVSCNEKDWALKHNLVSSDKLTVINNAINNYDYQSNVSVQNIKKRLDIEDSHCIVGAVGRLCKQKDWTTFIYAAHQILLQDKNVIFIIAGDGELSIQLDNLITKLNIKQNVLLLGYVEEITNLYQIFDLFVSTSLWEGLPYTLLEAMYFNLPIVASDIGYGDVLVDNYNAVLFTPTDYKQLAVKIIKLIKNKSVRERIGQKSYQTFGNFKFSTFIEEHEKLYLSKLN